MSAHAMAISEALVILTGLIIACIVFRAPRRHGWHAHGYTYPRRRYRTRWVRDRKLARLVRRWRLHHDQPSQYQPRTYDRR